MIFKKLWNDLFTGYADKPSRPITPTPKVSEFELGQQTGLALCAANIDHILETCPDNVTKEELIEKLQLNTSRWAEYEKDVYLDRRKVLLCEILL